MIEQYIYTRMDGGNSREYGHGLAFTTKGIVGDLEKDASTISRYSGSTVDGNGTLVKILEKRGLPSGGFTALQQSVRFPERSAAGDISEGDERLLYFSSTNRPQFLSHGLIYKTQDDSDTPTDPDRWFYQDFVDYNTNLKQPHLNPLNQLQEAKTPLEPLPKILAHMGLSLETFVSVVQSLFDTGVWDTITLVEIDFTQPGYQELSAQFLRWVFHFLPFGLRRQASFSTAYDTSCGGHDYAVALISSTMLTEERNGRITFRNMPNSVKYGYLFARDRCFHQSLVGHPEFGKSESPYALWLGAVIRQVYQEPYETSRNTVKTLEGIYRVMDEELRSGKQFRRESIEALLWAYLHNQFYKGEHIEVADAVAEGCIAETAELVKELLSLGRRNLIQNLLPDILCEAASPDADCEVWQDTLLQIRDLVGDSPKLEEALTVLLARLIETSNTDELRKKCVTYLERAQRVESDRTKLLEGVFFPEVSQPDWWAGLTRTGFDRAGTWLNAMIDQTSLDAYLSSTEEIIGDLAGFTPTHLTALSVQKIIPDANIPEDDFRELGRLTQCSRRLEKRYQKISELKPLIDAFYGRLENTWVKRWEEEIQQLTDEPAQLLKLMEAIHKAFKEDTTRERELLEMAIAQWEQTNRSDQFEDEPQLHDRLVKTICFSHEAGVSKEVLSRLYRLGCEYLCSGRYQYESKELYTSFPSLCNDVPGGIGGMYPLADTMKSVGLYLGNDDLGFVRFHEICGKDSENLEYCLTILTRLYEKEELPDLPAEIIAYAAYLEGERINPEKPNHKMETAFQQIRTVQGYKKLCELLDQYPPAKLCDKNSRGNQAGKIMLEEVFQTAQATLQQLCKKTRKTKMEPEPPRPGAFSWMITDSELIDALEKSLHDGIAKITISEEDILRLVDTIYRLCPPESVLNQEGRKLSTSLWRCWEESEQVSSNGKKQMREWKKKGAFSSVRKGLS